jgi:hypothetical protein
LKQGKRRLLHNAVIISDSAVTLVIVVLVGRHAGQHAEPGFGVAPWNGMADALACLALVLAVPSERRGQLPAAVLDGFGIGIEMDNNACTPMHSSQRSNFNGVAVEHPLPRISLR